MSRAFRGRAAVAALILLGTTVAVAQALPGPVMPKIEKALPPTSDRTPRAAVLLADYRYDDLLWENDRTAHRIYGHALEAYEPPSGSGIDAWGKNVPWPFTDRQLRSGDQHSYHGEGLDFYNVGTGRGDGGLGVWQDNKLWTSRNFVAHRILKSGPDVADFEVDYAPWPVGVDRKAWETRRFTLPMGTNFTRMISTIKSDKPGPMLIGIGIGRKALDGGSGQLTVDKEKGILSFWGPDDAHHGTMGIALRVDPKMIAEIRDDADNHLVLLTVKPGQPFVYYSGATWSLGIAGIRTRAEWDRAVAAEPVDFAPKVLPQRPR